MEKFKKKLRSKKGETLIETLVGMLIVVMASAVLAGGVVSATKINMKTRDIQNSAGFVYDKIASGATAPKMNIYLSSDLSSPIDKVDVNEYKDNGYVWFEKK